MDGARRTGDNIEIPGRYQFDAFHSRIPLQRFWHRAKFEVVEAFLPPAKGDRCLDIGCGSGVLADYLARTASFVLAVDGNPAAIDFARERFGRPGLEFRLGLVDEWFGDPGTFDKIYIFEVIEHVTCAQVEVLLERASSLLKPGGGVLITTPNYASLWPLLERAMDVLRLAPRLRDSQHVNRLNSAKFAALVAGSSDGLKMTRLTTIHRTAPWLSFVSPSFAHRLLRLELGRGRGWGCDIVARLDKTRLAAEDRFPPSNHP
jgi:2-polyprenyl-3-methyl-5-hydroxy-6-metoxy-1,4-benzoquinol methylase